MSYRGPAVAVLEVLSPQSCVHEFKARKLPHRRHADSTQLSGNVTISSFQLIVIVCSRNKSK